MSLKAVRIGYHKRFWEDRKENMHHALSAPLFYGISRKKAEKQMRDNHKAAIAAVILLDTLEKLSFLRCLGVFSEWLQQNAYVCGEENLKLEITEEKGRYEAVGNYIITIKEAFEGRQDTVIPIDSEPKSFALPYIIGEKVIKKYRRTGIMDLTILDKNYYSIREMCMEYANNIRQTMQEYGLSENSPVIRDLDRLRF